MCVPHPCGRRCWWPRIAFPDRPAQPSLSSLISEALLRFPDETLPHWADRSNIELSSSLSPVLRTDVIINYSPGGAQDQ